MDAAVEDVWPAFPGGAQPAGQEVHLKDLGAVAVHLGVAAGGQAGDPAADDDDRFVGHSNRFCLASLFRIEAEC
jgi:hypothetical protein